MRVTLFRKQSSFSDYTLNITTKWHRWEYKYCTSTQKESFFTNIGNGDVKEGEKIQLRAMFKAERKADRVRIDFNK